MGKRKKLYISSERYIPGHELYDQRPQKHYGVSIEVDIDELIFEVRYKKEKDDLYTNEQVHIYLYAELDKEAIKNLFKFLLKEMPQNEGESIELDVQTKNGIQRVRRNVSGISASEPQKNEYSIQHLLFEGRTDRIIIETFKGRNPIFPFYQREEGSTLKDRDNLSDLKKFSEDILQEVPDSRDRDTPTIQLSSELIEDLNATNWGSEVLSHLEDGNNCIRAGLYHPALNSYIHGIEWAIITYLEDKEGIDIIKQENNGNYYNFAGGKNNLLDEISKYKEISQKTQSKLRNMNSAERRWSAHHKSGELSDTEVIAVQERLEILIREVFGE